MSTRVDAQANTAGQNCRDARVHSSSNMRSKYCSIQPVLIVWLLVLLSSPVAGQVGFEGPPIDYLTADVNDPVAQLARRVAQGDVKLEFDSKHGYLKSVLAALEVPEESQTLVFSKTSLQLQRISPRRPRAVYFNDDVYVGWCQRGDVLEFAATDPQQGAIFYTLEQDQVEAPRFVRDRGQCLTCHASSRTQNVPGYLVRSVYADAAGQPILGSGTYLSDHTSPFDERWGGWYVTGLHGSMRHMGNMTFTEEDERGGDREKGANLKNLNDVVVTEPYLTDHSDIVALMVMEHQTQMHNAIAAANYETRLALHQSFQMNELLEREEGYISESADRRIDAVASQLLRYMLMCDEFKLEDQVAGTSGFAQNFESRGISDSKGRSLRQFDLKTRLFRYPCSYLIYNPAFDRLPDEVRSRVFRRLAGILNNSSDSQEDAHNFQHLTAELRNEIREILLETKPEFRNFSDRT